MNKYGYGYVHIHKHALLQPAAIHLVEAASLTRTSISAGWWTRRVRHGHGLGARDHLGCGDFDAIRGRE